MSEKAEKTKNTNTTREIRTQTTSPVKKKRHTLDLENSDSEDDDHSDRHTVSPTSPGQEKYSTVVMKNRTRKASENKTKRNDRN